MFPPANYPALLVGLGLPDDAAVYRLSDERAIVQTVDFFPPIVDDAYSFGAIAASNALSDIYAMGGDPIFALNLCAFPEDMPDEVVGNILRGGAEKVLEAGAAIAGGHSILDTEPKYGLTVTGFLNPKYMLSKGGAREGDALVLTKPLGVGVITTALKRELADSRHVDEATNSMMRLNRLASHTARELDVKSATDITGYGLIGHSLEMADQSGVCFEFEWDRIPFLPGANEYAERWIFAGGAETNAKAALGRVSFSDGLSDWQQMLLYDPQTSGGLLLSMSPEKVQPYLSFLHAAGEGAWQIGRVVSGKGIHVLKSNPLGN
jgi:selenide,water dikinase